MQIQTGIITISDRASRGLYDDLGGPALKKAAEGYGWAVLAETLVPDEKTKIQQAIREQIVGGITLLVQQARLRDGRRVITHISEITGLEGNSIQVQDICRFDQTGIDAEGNVLGAFRWTGVVPKLMPRLKANAEDFPMQTFGQGGLQVIEGAPPLDRREHGVRAAQE